MKERTKEGLPKTARNLEDALRLMRVLVGVEDPRPDDPSGDDMVRILQRTVQRWNRVGELLRFILREGNKTWYKSGRPSGNDGVRKEPADSLARIDRRGEAASTRGLRLSAQRHERTTRQKK